MKKLVLKTALITAGALVILFGIFCVVNLIFFPKSVANFFYSAGNYNASVKFYQKNYERTKAYEDLDLLCVKLDTAYFYDSSNYDKVVSYYELRYNAKKTDENLYQLCVKLDADNHSAKTEEYTNTLMKLDNFHEFCAQKDSATDTMTTEEFIEGKHIVASLKNGEDFNLVLENALELVRDESGYTLFNPFKMLYTVQGLELSSQQLNSIKQAIASNFLRYNSEEQVLAGNDISAIDQLINA